MRQKYHKDQVIAFSDQELLAEIQKVGDEFKSYHVGCFIARGAYLLVKESCQRFGRWPDIVRQLGIDPEAEKIMDSRVLMTEQQVLKEIMRFEMSGRSLKEKAVSSDCPILLKSARKHFITWGLALKTAGITTKR